MIKNKISSGCAFCGKNAAVSVEVCGKKLKLCADCAKELYRELGKSIVPKSIPNMILKFDNKR